MAHPRVVSDGSFDQDVRQSQVPVLVSFFAPWCTPCAATAEVTDALAGDFGDRIRVLRVNTDTSPITTAKYSADHVPAYLLFWNGEPLKAIPSHLAEAALRTQIQAALDQLSDGGSVPTTSAEKPAG